MRIYSWILGRAHRPHARCRADADEVHSKDYHVGNQLPQHWALRQSDPSMHAHRKADSRMHPHAHLCTKAHKRAGRRARARLRLPGCGHGTSGSGTTFRRRSNTPLSRLRAVLVSSDSTQGSAGTVETGEQLDRRASRARVRRSTDASKKRIDSFRRTG
jgi:hypothetical protein